ncbi:MAG: hypothetical protein L0L87_03725, partial [Tetragenococcus koreensis]|nr:hypothetical protein [Tetragenococcus koreensis]
RLLVAQYTAPAITRRTIHCSCDYSSHNTLLLRLLVANSRQLGKLIKYSSGIFNYVTAFFYRLLTPSLTI